MTDLAFGQNNIAPQPNRLLNRSLVTARSHWLPSFREAPIIEGSCANVFAYDAAPGDPFGEGRPGARQIRLHKARGKDDMPQVLLCGTSVVPIGPASVALGSQGATRSGSVNRGHKGTRGDSAAPRGRSSVSRHLDQALSFQPACRVRCRCLEDLNPYMPTAKCKVTGGNICVD